MPISDNNPERRNLVVTSIGFIAYYLGDGRIDNEILKIQAISITFENTAVLAAMAWIMLFWFFIRYKQIHGGMLQQAILNEAVQEKRNSILIKYLQQKTGKPYCQQNGFIIHDIEPRKGNWQVQIALIVGGKNSGNNQWVEYRTKPDEKFNINRVWGGLLRYSIVFSIAPKSCK